MIVFISHNKDDKTTARLLATAIIEAGVSVWFDEWELRPGDSIVGGIEDGVTRCDVFVLMWSKSAKKSDWVGTELRAMLTRSVAGAQTRIVPISLDKTQLPSLVAEYKGFDLAVISDLRRIAGEITGITNRKEIAHLLQRRLHELADSELEPDNPVRVVVCPECASKNLDIKRDFDYLSEKDAYFVMCGDCSWGTAKLVKCT